VAAAVTRADVGEGIRELGLSGRPVCLHASLRSFGRVEGGADAVVDAFLDEECTLLVPAFTWGSLVAPPGHMRSRRNGVDYETPQPSPGAGLVYRPDTLDVEPRMGAIAAAVVRRPGRARGLSQLCSFAAVGPGADSLVGPQRPLDVYPPLRLLAARGGVVLLAGVGLTSMTLIHAAEEKAGRRLFRRWANATDGLPMEVEVGGCSNGFDSLEPLLAPLARETHVGDSRWRAFPAREALAAAAEAIREDPELTRCDDPGCLRCRDAIAGGPQFSA
jgi:aminoglycoside 3-N-acetyltransferase